MVPRPHSSPDGRRLALMISPCRKLSCSSPVADGFYENRRARGVGQWRTSMQTMSLPQRDSDARHAFQSGCENGRTIIQREKASGLIGGRCRDGTCEAVAEGTLSERIEHKRHECSKPLVSFFCPHLRPENQRERCRYCRSFRQKARRTDLSPSRRAGWVLSFTLSQCGSCSLPPLYGI